MVRSKGVRSVHPIIIVCCLMVDPSVLEFVEWSSGLEDHFASQAHNLTNAFDVTYQYFGNRQGILRLYPAVCPCMCQSNLCTQCVYSLFMFSQRPSQTHSMNATDVRTLQNIPFILGGSHGLCSH